MFCAMIIPINVGLCPVIWTQSSFAPRGLILVYDQYENHLANILHFYEDYTYVM